MEQNRALRVLEFTKIREMLAQNAITEEGRQRCLELVPCHDLGDVNHALAETEEAVVLLTYLGQNPLVSYPDVRESIARAQKGACLSPRMLLDISAFLRAARAARSALVRDRDDTPILTGLASRLTVLERVETDINDAILSEEEIADRASTELYQIRRQIRGANERMREKLNQMIRSSSFAKNLQDSIITMRGDRYCIPVKAECRANVPGLVHDQSASGATLFIEPMFVVELGNDLKQLYAREQQEITRILQALSDSLAPYGEALEGNLALLPQNPQTVFVRDRLRDDFAELLEAQGVKKEERDARIASVAEKIGVAALLDQHPYDLSGGEQQKCAIAKMLLLEPRILLMDEPTKGLDAHAKRVLRDILRALKADGITILMVTHDVAFAAENADRCALFFDGEVLSADVPERFFAENNFYTTAANRMARRFWKYAVTCEQVTAREALRASEAAGARGEQA